MNIGDYVRTETGQIGKITYFEGDMARVDCDKFITYKNNHNEITKISPNIKSVIEENDFVNGERITRVIPEDICGDELLDYQHIFIGDKEIYEEDIKSVLTHEQFENMEYKVGEQFE